MALNKNSISKTTFDISIIVNAHKEGHLLRDSLISAFRSRRFAEENGLKIETILVLDSADPLTSSVAYKYLEGCPLGLDFIVEVNHACLGAARNAGIRKCRGEFIAFLDGDDMFSKNWLCEAYLLCSQNTQIIAHPDFNLYFGEKNHWWRHTDQEDPDFIPSSLLYFNYWTALSFAHKSIYEKIPYHTFRPDSGFGYEDWHWNCETIAADYQHKVTNNTAHFIRLKAGVGSLHNQAKKFECLIPKTSYFKTNLFLSDVTKAKASLSVPLKSTLRKLIPKQLKKLLKQSDQSHLPEWISKEILEISSVRLQNKNNFIHQKHKPARSNIPFLYSSLLKMAPGRLNRLLFEILKFSKDYRITLKMHSIQNKAE